MGLAFIKGKTEPSFPGFSRLKGHRISSAVDGSGVAHAFQMVDGIGQVYDDCSCTPVDDKTISCKKPSINEFFFLFLDSVVEVGIRWSTFTSNFQPRIEDSRLRMKDLKFISSSNSGSDRVHVVEDSDGLELMVSQGVESQAITIKSNCASIILKEPPEDCVLIDLKQDFDKEGLSGKQKYDNFVSELGKRIQWEQSSVSEFTVKYEEREIIFKPVGEQLIITSKSNINDASFRQKALEFSPGSLGRWWSGLKLFVKPGSRIGNREFSIGFQ